ncbi:hypothetical protein [Kutzneria sp. 744]|uniref:hypothetical protein n=1 Tax=Kutzneria sp. (strain 744) TaxID=345341 RepID=UPI0004B8FD98|nr:hypothetical protein [Kutzneria sp. 744]
MSTATESPFAALLNKCLAPVTTRQDAMIADSETLNWARAVYAAFGDHDEGDGLTKEELTQHCAGAGPGRFEPRFDHFMTTKMLSTDKAGGHRYVLDDSSAVMLLIIERLLRADGVAELIILLERTQEDLALGLLSRQEVSDLLVLMRQKLSIECPRLERLSAKPVEDVLRYRRLRRNGDALVPRARKLIDVVASTFPELHGLGTRLIAEAQRYSLAVSAVVDRIASYARARRDFSLLAPGQYLDAVRAASVDQLAEVFASTVFDRPELELRPDEVAVAAEEFRPTPSRVRPPRSIDLGPLTDPIDLVRDREERVRGTRRHRLGELLDGERRVDLTPLLLEKGWPGAVELVVWLMAAVADRSLGCRIELSDRLLVDSTATVTYLTPVQLVRSGGT